PKDFLLAGAIVVPELAAVVGVYRPPRFSVYLARLRPHLLAFAHPDCLGPGLLSLLLDRLLGLGCPGFLGLFLLFLCRSYSRLCCLDSLAAADFFPTYLLPMLSYIAFHHRLGCF